MPLARGGWVVMDDQHVILSEHVTATDAELAAAGRLRDGEQLVLYDRYHRCRTVRRAGDPSSRA